MDTRHPTEQTIERWLRDLALMVQSSKVRLDKKEFQGLHTMVKVIAQDSAQLASIVKKYVEEIDATHST